MGDKNIYRSLAAMDVPVMNISYVDTRRSLTLNADCHSMNPDSDWLIFTSLDCIFESDTLCRYTADIGQMT